MARVLVQQSQSLWSLWKEMREEMSVLQDIVLDDDLVLEDVPEIVNLKWIQSARRDVADFLSLLVDYLCTASGLQALCNSQNLQKLLQSSTANAKVALSHLQLDMEDTPSQKPMTTLSKSIGAYRLQAQALAVALWSCQQAKTESDRKDWWNQAKQLSQICQSMEERLDQELDPVTSTNEDPSTIEPTARITPQDSEEYEHGSSEPPRPSRDPLPRSTKVYTGKGSLPEVSRGIRTESTPSTSTPHSLPPLDTLSERMLLAELSQRVACLRSQDEEESSLEEEHTRERDLPMGVSGMVLQELQGALSVRQEEEEWG